MGWLKFTFGFQGVLENEIKRVFKKEAKVVRTEQQKEPAKLLAHFHQRIVIKNVIVFSKKKRIIFQFFEHNRVKDQVMQKQVI